MCAHMWLVALTSRHTMLLYFPFLTLALFVKSSVCHVFCGIAKRTCQISQLNVTTLHCDAPGIYNEEGSCTHCSNQLMYPFTEKVTDFIFVKYIVTSFLKHKVVRQNTHERKDFRHFNIKLVLVL